MEGSFLSPDRPPTSESQMSAPKGPAPSKAFNVTDMLEEKKHVNITAVRMEAPLTIGQQIMRRLDFSLVAFKHTWKIISRNKLNYCLGFAACFTLVFVVALVQTVLNQAPVIFLRMAETRNGEVDFRYTPGSWSNYRYLNHSLMTQHLTPITDFTYHSPRYDMTLFLYSGNDCKNMSGYSLQDPTWKYLGTAPGDTCSGKGSSEKLNCVATHCPQKDSRTGATIRTSARVFLIDYEREALMGYGRQWTLAKPPQGSLHMLEKLAKDMKVNVGDTVFLHVDGYKYWPELFTAAAGSSYATMLSQWADMHVPFTVASTFAGSYGKYDSGVSNPILLDYNTFMAHIGAHIHPNASLAFKQNVTHTPLSEYAQQVVHNLPPSRITPYIDSNFDVIRGRIIRFGSEAVFRLGFTDINVEQPIVRRLQSLNFFSLFMGLIMSIIVTVLAFLSITLVYSLLMINVETRTFEMGVLRMVGMSRTNLIQLLLTQAIMYAIPGWALGLIVAQVLMIGVSQVFISVVGLTIPVLLDPSAIGLVTALGILVPLFAAVFPIRTALSMHLQDSLDVRRSKTQAVKISIERSEDSNVSPAVIVVGFCLVVFGFLIYYFMPLALISLNLGLLLQMFFFLLLGMLFGLVMLSLNLEHIAELFVGYLFLFWEKTYIFDLVMKNLIAHRERNRKTTLMFALSLGFIIFVVVAFQVAIDTFSFEEQQESGAYMKVQAGGLDVDGIPWAIKKVSQYEAYVSSSPYIKQYGWVTHHLYDAIKARRDSVQIANIGKLYFYTNYIYGISPNLLDTMIPGYLFPSLVPSTDPYRIEEALYTPAGSSKMLMGSLYRTSMSLNLTTDLFVAQVEATSPRSTYYWDRMRPMAFYDGGAFFTLSQFPSDSSQDALVSIPTFVRLSHGAIQSVNDIPMRQMMLQFYDGVTDSQKDQIKKDLEQITNTESGVSVYDYRDQVDEISTAGDIMNYFFVFTTFVVMLICFFSLVSSMYTNMVEQTKEIAILRAIGMRSFWLQRVYIEEAFVIIFSASAMGLVIGILIGWTMAVQRALFTQLPIQFLFPYTIFCLVFGLSIIMAFLSSLGPSRKIINMSVVEGLRLAT